MEHRLILGGEQYLPFARSCITKLKKLGLAYVDQSYEVDGTSIKVRITPGHEYIRIEGGLFVGFAVATNWAKDAFYIKTTSGWKVGKEPVPQIATPPAGTNVVQTRKVYIPVATVVDTSPAKHWVSGVARKISNAYHAGTKMFPVVLSLPGGIAGSPLVHHCDGFRIYAGSESAYALVPPLYEPAIVDDPFVSGLKSTYKFVGANTDTAGTNFVATQGLVVSSLGHGSLAWKNTFLFSTDVAVRVTNTEYAGTAHHESSGDTGELVAYRYARDRYTEGSSALSSSASLSLESTDFTTAEAAWVASDTGYSPVGFKCAKNATHSQSFSGSTEIIQAYDGDSAYNAPTYKSRHTFSSSSTTTGSPETSISLGWKKLVLLEGTMTGSSEEHNAQTDTYYLRTTAPLTDTLELGHAYSDVSVSRLSSTSEYTMTSRYLLAYDHRSHFCASIRVSVTCPPVVSTLFSNSLTSSTVLHPATFMANVYFESDWNGVTYSTLLFSASEELMPLLLSTITGPARDMAVCSPRSWRAPPVDILYPASALADNFAKICGAQGTQTTFGAADIPAVPEDVSLKFPRDFPKKYVSGMIYAENFVPAGHPALWLLALHGFALPGVASNFHIELRDGLPVRWSDEFHHKTEGGTAPASDDRIIKIFRV